MSQIVTVITLNIKITTAYNFEKSTFPTMMYQTIRVQGQMQTVQIQIRLLLLQPKAYRKTSVEMSK